MSHSRWLALGLLCVTAVPVACSGSPDAPTASTATAISLGAVNVLTRHNDNQQTGANLSETVLNTSNVATNFGKLFTLPVDDQIYAQPLYASQMPIAGGTHNVVFAATMGNSVYAFDADAPAGPLWSANFSGSGVPVTNGQVGQMCGTYQDISGNIGIVGTPVI